ncbi:hypothetical protein C2E23DRAFT_887589 [Lenzites betulinus]|nr:hypothetical protein C2E23DRAFT_887589 [Lenzites betulinus]
MSQTNPQAAASMTSLATTEGGTATPSASTTTLVPKKTSPVTPTAAPPVKDYEAAYAALSSSYGFTGAILTKNPKKKSKNKKDKAKADRDAGTSEGGQSGQSAPKK